MNSLLHPKKEPAWAPRVITTITVLAMLSVVTGLATPAQADPPPGRPFWVSELSGDRLFHFNGDGTLDFSFQPGYEPRGVLVYNDVLYVVGSDNQLHTLNKDTGASTGTVGSGGLSDPWQVAIKDANNIFVACYSTSNGSIRKWNGSSWNSSFVTGIRYNRAVGYRSFGNNVCFMNRTCSIGNCAADTAPENYTCSLATTVNADSGALDHTEPWLCNPRWGQHPWSETWCVDNVSNIHESGYGRWTTGYSPSSIYRGRCCYEYYPTMEPHGYETRAESVVTGHGYSSLPTASDRGIIRGLINEGNTIYFCQEDELASSPKGTVRYLSGGLNGTSTLFVGPGLTNFNQPAYITFHNPPPSACCHADGSCTDELPWDCEDPGDVFNDGQTCPPTPACPPAWACCLVDGTCQDVTENYCTATLNGVWHDGDTCGTYSCPEAEACCLPDGACEDYILSECAAQGGTSMGPASTCAGTIPCEHYYGDYRGGPDIIIQNVPNPGGYENKFNRVKPYRLSGSNNIFVVARAGRYGSLGVMKHLPQAGTVMEWADVTKWTVTGNGSNGEWSFAAETDGDVYTTYMGSGVERFQFSDFSGTPGSVSSVETRYFFDQSAYPTNGQSCGLQITDNGRFYIGFAYYDVNVGYPDDRWYTKLKKYNSWGNLPTSPSDSGHAWVLSCMHNPQCRYYYGTCTGDPYSQDYELSRFRDCMADNDGTVYTSQSWASSTANEGVEGYVRGNSGGTTQASEYYTGGTSKQVGYVWATRAGGVYIVEKDAELVTPVPGPSIYGYTNQPSSVNLDTCDFTITGLRVGRGRFRVGRRNVGRQCPRPSWRRGGLQRVRHTYLAGQRE